MYQHVSFKQVKNNEIDEFVDDDDNENDIHGECLPPLENILLIKNTRRNKKDYEHWLQIKFQPKSFSDAIKSLTPEHKKWVISVGFGSLLSLKMNE